MAMPAIIDSATVYRVFMIPSHSPAEHQRPGPLEIMPRSRATRNEKRLERATIVPSYDRHPLLEILEHRRPVEKLCRSNRRGDSKLLALADEVIE